MTVALHQAPARPYRQHPALHPRPFPAQVGPVGEEIALGPGRLPPGGDGIAALPVHFGDDEVDAGPHHVLEHIVRSGLASPHLGGGERTTEGKRKFSRGTR